MSYPKGSGIYAIINTVNARRYVGQGTFGSRWPSHKALLRSNKHYNKQLQADWNEYGEDSFNFVVLEIVTDGHFDVLEQHYILQTSDSYNSDATTRMIRGDRGSRGVQCLPAARDMSLGMFAQKLFLAGTGMDYQAARKYWYGTKDGSRDGEPIHMLSLNQLGMVKEVLNISMHELLQHLTGDFQQVT